MWSGLLSAALLYGVLSTTIVFAVETPTQQSQVAVGGTLTGTPTPKPPIDGTGSGGETGSGSEVVPKAGQTAPDSATSSPTPVPGIDASSGSNGARITSTSGASGLRSPERTPKASKPNVGAIAGGVVGGVVLLVLVGALIFFLRKRKRTRDPLGYMEKTADERAANESPSPPVPAPVATTSSSPHPHSPTAPNEGLALMSHYGEAQPQHIPQEVQPVIMPNKPYDVNPSSREIPDGDEDLDGVSINSPSPVTTPSPERQQEQQRSVPRLPIYQGGRQDDTGGNTPPPAL